MKKLFVLFIVFILFVSCKNEQNAQSFYVKALDSYSKQDFSKAIENIDLSLKYSCDFYQAKFLKAKILYFLNESEKSLKIINSLVKKYPEYTEARIWKIRLLIDLKQYEKAAILLERELSFNPSDWRLYYQSSLLSERKEEMDKRLVMLNKASFYISESYNVYVELADLWIKLGIRSTAIENLDKAILISNGKDELKQLREYLSEGKNLQ